MCLFSYYSRFSIGVSFGPHSTLWMGTCDCHGCWCVFCFYSILFYSMFLFVFWFKTVTANGRAAKLRHILAIFELLPLRVGGEERRGRGGGEGSFWKTFEFYVWSCKRDRRGPNALRCTSLTMASLYFSLFFLGGGRLVVVKLNGERRTSVALRT